MSFVDLSAAEVKELFDSNFATIRAGLVKMSAEDSTALPAEVDMNDVGVITLAFKLAQLRTREQVDAASWSRHSQALSLERTLEAQAGEYISPRRAAAERKWLAFADGELVIRDLDRDAEPA